MIAYLEGRLSDVSPTAAVVITEGGVGYEVFLPGHTLSRLPAKGAQVIWHICHIVREDAQELFGFESWDERQTFRVLTGISKVGARTALAMLSVYRPDDLRRLVVEDDLNALTRVPGIGKKTAQHILLELKYKLKTGDAASFQTGSGQPASVLRDVLDGLAGLGYSEDEAGPLVRSVLKDDPDLDVSEALRATLKALAKGRG